MDLVDRGYVKRRRSHLSCIVLSPTAHLKTPNCHLPKTEKQAMPTTGIDTQGFNWIRPPGRRLGDKPRESLIGDGCATWRRSPILMWSWSITATPSSHWKMLFLSVPYPLEMVQLARTTIQTLNTFMVLIILARKILLQELKKSVCCCENNALLALLSFLLSKAQTSWCLSKILCLLRFYSLYLK